MMMMIMMVGDEHEEVFLKPPTLLSLLAVLGFGFPHPEGRL